MTRRNQHANLTAFAEIFDLQRVMESSSSMDGSLGAMTRIGLPEPRERARGVYESLRLPQVGDNSNRFDSAYVSEAAAQVRQSAAANGEELTWVRGWLPLRKRITC